MPQQQNEHVNDTPARALSDAIGLQPAAVGLLVFGVESLNSPFPPPAYGVIALGGLLATISGKRWQDFHEMRDQRQRDLS